MTGKLHEKLLLTKVSSLFILLQTCDDIQTLELSVEYIHRWRGHKSAMERMRCFKALIVALQRIKHFAVTLNRSDATFLAFERRVMKGCKVVEKYLQDQLQVNKNTTAVNMTKLRKAKECARLDVHGEGRLSKDRKPGFISSRTRQGVKFAEALTPDGTIPTLPIAKYDSEGALNWIVLDILDVREVRGQSRKLWGLLP